MMPTLGNNGTNHTIKMMFLETKGFGLFNETDHHTMKLALHEAATALSGGDYPVGAALVVDGVLWGTGRNAIFSEERTTAHAEHTLISQYSAQLRKIVREKPEKEICLYTTLEPCLMCLGIIVMHRISRLVIACPDPFGGVTTFDHTQLGPFYGKWWPKIEIGLYKEKSCDLILEFLKTEKLFSWQEMVTKFHQMQVEWEITAPSNSI
jgi:tRNA(Arg) A34 adenosine deaminase TadA